MIIRIPCYTAGYRIVSLAKCVQTLNRLLERSLDTIYLENGKLTLYPDEVLLTDDAAVLERFSYCDDYDVFEVDSQGRAFLYYNNESLDNAFFLTGKCNSNCVMCPASETSRRLGTTSTLKHLLQLVEHIPSDAAHITITGGEPFLLGREIFPFLKALRDKFSRTEFLLLTNGRIFCREDYCDLLYAALPSHTVIGIPLHGYDAFTHDRITQVRGSYYQTYQGLKNLLSWGFQVELRVVISKLTAPTITQIAQQIAEEFPTVASVKFIGLEMLGNAAKHQDMVWISYPRAFRAAEQGARVLIGAGIDVRFYNFPLCAVDQAFWPICAKSITDYKVRYAENCTSCCVKDACGGVFSGTFRLAKGDMVPIWEEKLC